MMKDEGWMMKDKDSSCWGVLLTNRQTNRWMNRQTFVILETEKQGQFQDEQISRLSLIFIFGRNLTEIIKAKRQRPKSGIRDYYHQIERLIGHNLGNFLIDIV